jgi:NADPH:quinone reductase
MRAWTWNGSPQLSDLQLCEQPLPELKGDEVLIANKAIALNPVECKVISFAALGWNQGHIPGADGAGVVAACGPAARIQLRTRVAYHQDLKRDGSFSTHTVVAGKALLPLPEDVSFTDAATVPCPGLTAWQAISKFPDAPGRDVLIVGGGSATGSYLVQLAEQRGYRVWTTASPRHFQWLRGLGVANVFDYHDQDWRELLLQALEGRRLYAAIDNISEAHARSLAPLIGYNGHLVCISERLTTPAVPRFSTVISQHEVMLGGIYQNGCERDWDDLEHAGAEILQRIASGTIRVPPVSMFAFERLPEALASLKAGSQVGKLVAEL